jgi:hypothetical protein
MLEDRLGDGLCSVQYDATSRRLCCCWCLQAEFRTIVFALSYFHAALLERKKFGVGNLPGATSGIGWNMNYPFNTGDLLCCGQCTSNYLENNVKVCTIKLLLTMIASVPTCVCMQQVQPCM